MNNSSERRLRTIAGSLTGFHLQDLEADCWNRTEFRKYSDAYEEACFQGLLEGDRLHYEHKKVGILTPTFDRDTNRDMSTSYLEKTPIGAVHNWDDMDVTMHKILKRKHSNACFSGYSNGLNIGYTKPKYYEEE